MTQELAAKGQVIEQILIKGDLSGLDPAQRAEYAIKVCDSVGLNPLTKPFDYINLGGKLVLYAKRDATDQLRKIYNVSIKIVSREMRNDLYVVTANASLPNGRHDESIGAVFVAGLKGDALANAIMKAETKSKRRVTLSICGLGLLDETEIETVPNHEPPKHQLIPLHEEMSLALKGQAASPETNPKKERTRLEVGQQIVQIAKTLQLSNDEMAQWVHETYSKDMKSLSVAEMEGFLQILENELGRRGEMHG